MLGYFRLRRVSRWMGLAGLACLLASGVTAAAEDELVTQRRIYRGKVKSSDANGIVMEIRVPGGQSVITLPRKLVLKATVEAPPGVNSGIAAYEKGNYKEAQASLGKTIKQYQGLDVGWASTSQIYYARACLAAGDLQKAQRAFVLFATNYPEHVLFRDAQVGLAEIDLAKKNYESALGKYRGLAEYFDKQLKPSRTESAIAARIYLGMGQCLEGLSKPAEALKAYLHLVALYPVEPYCPEALFRSAMLYSGLGQAEQAKIRLTALVNDYPSSAWGSKAVEEKKKIASRSESKPASSR